MYSDYHIHTHFSGDCSTPAAAQIEKAIQLNMDELCITDHHDYDVDSGDINFELDIPSYLTHMNDLKETYKDQIKIRIGLELGLQAHLADYLTRLLSQYSFDFIIGSTHFIRGKDPYYPSYFENRREQDAIREFFLETLKNVKSFRNYDVLGHLDYIIRYCPTKDQNYVIGDYQDIIEEILSVIIKAGIGLECNTSGLRSGISQPNPHIDILKCYRQLGGEIITLGSDSHITDTLGYRFDFAKEILISSGFRYYCTFSDRKPAFHPL